MWDIEALEKFDDAYFLKNGEWYEVDDFEDEEAGGPSAEELDAMGYHLGFRLTDKAPQEAVESYNRCFNLNPDSNKDVIPYFLTNAAWYRIDEDSVKRNLGGVYQITDAAPPEALWSYRSYYSGCCGDEHVIPYFMLDASWYEKDEHGRPIRLTSKAPYLARASFVDYMHPCFIRG